LVVTIDGDVQIDEAIHRQALKELHDQIMIELHEWHHRLIQRLPEADYPKQSIIWNLDKAPAVSLTRAELRELATTEKSEQPRCGQSI
jgi:hypothetical protein